MINLFLKCTEIFNLTINKIYYNLFYVLILFNIIKTNYYNLFSFVINYCYSKIYDKFFGNSKFKLSTPNLFYYSLQKINKKSKILDFGCGNGLCYDNEKVINLIISNNLNIYGIDIDQIYLEECKKRIEKNKLQEYIKIKLMNVFDYKIEDEENKFDYIIFSESAPVMSQKLLEEIINYINNNLIKKNGKIIFINNISYDSNNIKYVKPYLKYFIGIDFGRLLTFNEFSNYANKFDKEIEFNLIESMKLKEILSYFYLDLLYIFCIFLSISNYNVDQYEIILKNKN